MAVFVTGDIHGNPTRLSKDNFYKQKDSSGNKDANIVIFLGDFGLVWNIEKVKLLKEICDKSNAKVVISSSWRGSENHIPKIYYILRDILKNNGIEVMGNTPHLSAEFEDKGVQQAISLDEQVINLDDISRLKCKYGTGRAAEVKKWIDEHEVDNFVILDDEDWDWSDYGYENNWIQPTWYENGGLKREHVDKAIEILNQRK